MIRSSTLKLALGATACLLAACADLETTGNGGQMNQMTPQNKAWIAFMSYHVDRGTALHHGISLVGPVPHVIVTQTAQEQSMNLFGGSTTDYINAYQDFGKNCEQIILSSNDPDLINLHHHLVAVENAFSASPESAHYEQSLAQQNLIDRAYTPTTEYHGESSTQVIERGGTAADLQAVYDQEHDADGTRGVEAARLELAKQRDPATKKAAADRERSGAALNKAMSRYTLPSSEFFTVMRKYVPPGSKCWSYIRKGDLHDILFLGSVPEYGTWSY